MKVCIYGVGAIGGLIASRVGATGVQLSAIARGETLRSLQCHGLRVQSNSEITTTKIHAVENPADIGPQDIVVLSIKGPSLPTAVENIGPLLGPETMVLVAMNGVPWWFFHGLEGPYSGMKLESVDPYGALDRAIPVHHVIGCVVYPNCVILEPGLVKHNFGNKFIIGEPTGAKSERLRRISSLLEFAKFDVTESRCIQKDIWDKLLGNMAHNPVSALTGATCDRIIDDSLVARFCLAIMREAEAIGEKVGCTGSQNCENINAKVRQFGAFKTSMLHDVEAGKPLEIDSLLTVVHEIALKLECPSPNIDALLGLTRLFGQVKGLYN